MDNKEQLLNRYFEGNLTKEESILFQSLLTHDEEFAEEFGFQEKLKKAIALSESAKLKGRLQTYEAERNLRPKRVSLKWVAVAASVIIAVMVSYFLVNKVTPNTEELYATYYSKYPNTVAPIVRGDLEPLLKPDSAFRAYEKGDYGKASQLFDALYADGNEEHFLFYKAMSQMEMKRFNEASETLESYQWSEGYKGKAAWYHALCVLRIGKLSDARQLFDTIVNERSFNYPEAQQLLEDL